MIYLDNAATSCPKPPGVAEAVSRALNDVCANPSRGAYDLSLQASRDLLRTRRAVARLFNIADEARVIFTLNATHALNMAIKGVLDREAVRRGAGSTTSVGTTHVVTSSLEHNSVARPLAALARRGVEITRVPCSADGTTLPDDILAAVRPDTALVVLTHASNVLGTVLPIMEVGLRLRAQDTPFLVDAAQTAGVFPIDVQAMGITMLAASGHKGLLGPQGVGVLYVAPDVELTTLVEGGTGSRSESLEQPLAFPDRFEAGTPNSPGIAGLGAGLDVIVREGIGAIARREYALARRLCARLHGVDGITLFGPWAHGPGAAGPPTDSEDDSDWPPPVAPIVSVAADGLASAEAARVLDKQFGIAVRAGLHCAPEAHRVSGTLETGLVRLSIGHLTTEAEVDAAADALLEIAARPQHYLTREWESHHAR